MSSKLLSILLLFLLSAFVSCQPVEVEPAPGMPKIKTITHYRGEQVSSESYQYDAMGRLVKLTYADHWQEYEYRADKIMVKYLMDNYSRTDTLFLNDQGLVATQQNGRVIREYTTDSIQNKSTQYNYEGELEGVIDYKVSDGNVAAYESWMLKEGKLQLKTSNEFEYLPHSVNTIGHENMGMAFLGKQNKNLVSVFKWTNHDSNTQGEEKYHYEWDAHNRVVRSSGDDPENNYTIYFYY